MVLPAAAEGMPLWWLVFLSTSTIVAITVSVLVPIAIAGGMMRDGKQQKEERLETREGGKSPTKRRSPKKDIFEDDGLPLEEEPWVPKMEIKEWKEANQFSGCPWNFEGCETIEEVLACIWRKPLAKGLEYAYEALCSKVAKVSVARVHIRYNDEVYFNVLYTLNSGAELFGGEPIDQGVGLELPDEEEEGLRRRGSPSRTRADFNEAPDLALPCLSLFYRIHDGFGCLLSTKHLPIILEHPSDTIHGSCFYVYPVRDLIPLARRPNLVKFARVDKNCVACADCREENPYVVFAEHTGDFEDDDESPLDFVADTVCNIAGRKVVPNMSGHYGYS